MTSPEPARACGPTQPAPGTSFACLLAIPPLLDAHPTPLRESNADFKRPYDQVVSLAELHGQGLLPETLLARIVWILQDPRQRSPRLLEVRLSCFPPGMIEPGWRIISSCMRRMLARAGAMPRIIRQNRGSANFNPRRVSKPRQPLELTHCTQREDAICEGHDMGKTPGN